MKSFVTHCITIVTLAQPSDFARYTLGKSKGEPWHKQYPSALEAPLVQPVSRGSQWCINRPSQAYCGVYRLQMTRRDPPSTLGLMGGYGGAPPAGVPLDTSESKSFRMSPACPLSLHGLPANTIVTVEPHSHPWALRNPRTCGTPGITWVTHLVTLGWRAPLCPL